MTHFAFVLVAVACSPSAGETLSLFREASISPLTLAQAANHYVSLGEEAAVKELMAIAAIEHGGNFGRGTRTAERIGWVCRILYQPKGKKPLREPRYGGISSDFNFETAPLEDWPLFPIAIFGSTYFVLGELSLLAGVAEDPEDYLDYCHANGVFRKTPIPLPKRDQAMRDAERLRQSEAWKAIKWRAWGQPNGVSMSERRAWDFIKKQAEAIPGR